MSPARVVKPTDEEVQRRRIIGINAETVTNVTSTDFPGHYVDEDNSWDVQEFQDRFKVQLHTNYANNATFSLIGLDASVANAFRRILIAEIPTLAIEMVFMHNNTSIIQDEVLAARLGLIPLKGNKEGLHRLRWKVRDPTNPENEQQTDYNTVVLKLVVECTWKEGAQQLAIAGETDPDKLYENHNVYARDIEFVPNGWHSEYFGTEETQIQPVNPDALIAKLRPGQKIDLEMFAIKGLGGDHAKFSPVCPASYRLLPHIDIKLPIIGADAKKFARCFPKGVIGYDKVTKEEASQSDEHWRNAHRGSKAEDKNPFAGHEGETKAIVVNPMLDTVSRECLRHDEFKNKVKLGRIRDHFIFQVESTGQWDSDELFLESVKVLKLKCERVKRALEKLMR